MFGYVNINKNGLTKEEMEKYQSYYCGLCHALKERNGRKGQMLLNYDMTFLVVLLSGLYELEEKDENFFCPLHPASKHRLSLNRASDYAADMNVLLSYQSFADDWKDDNSLSKRWMMRIFDQDYKELFERYPRQGRSLEEAMEKLAKAEKSGESNVDVVAGITGEFLAEIFAWEDGMWSEDLRCLGFYLGKFIYIMDAYEDIDKDISLGRYNVLCQIRTEHRDDFDTIVRAMLVSMMGEAAQAFERMPIIENAALLRNILYSGIWCRYEYIQKKKNKKEKTNEKPL